MNALTASSRVEVDRPQLDAGLAMLRQGGDFGDGCLIVQARQARSDRIVTFDKRFARLGGAMMMDAQIADLA